MCNVLCPTTIFTIKYGTHKLSRFAIATQVADGRRILLRTFSSVTETDSGFTIVEACLATSAAPLIFAPLQKDYGGSTELFIDGGLGYNNPVRLLIQEFYSKWPNQKVGVLVSVGTGGKVPREVKGNLVSLAQKVAEMATDAAKQAEEFEQIIASQNKDLRNVYFRFDMVHRLADISLDEWRMLGIISQRTRTLMSSEDYSYRFERCAHLLVPRSIKTLGCKYSSRFQGATR
jgi:predicted acylesterase/phospholipase RssA